jgi:hypothetical protein
MGALLGQERYAVALWGVLGFQAFRAKFQPAFNPFFVGVLHTM